MAEIKIYGTLVNDTNEAIVKSTQVAAVKQDGTAATQSAVNADLYAKYAAVGNAYRVKGTKATIADVTGLTTKAIGDVWNVTAEFTLNSKVYPAGTNVVWTGSEWDPLGGTVDLAALEAKMPTKVYVRPNDGGLEIVLQGSNGDDISYYLVRYANESFGGWMSSDDKKKLDGIGEGATVKSITVNGMTSPVIMRYGVADIQLDAAGMPTDLRYSNGKIYLSNNYQGVMYPTTIQAATQSVPGFMSATDKSKLDGIAAGAQVNVLESVKVNGTALNVSEKSVNIDLSPYAKSADTIHVADVVATATDMNLKLRKAAGETPICNAVFHVATTSTAGLMSAADKQRLNESATIGDRNMLQGNIDALKGMIETLEAKVAALEAALTLK